MLVWIKRGAVALLVVLVAVAVVAWLLLRGSLPGLEGSVGLPGLSAPVTVQRDALGTVTIEAAAPDDAMRALGYVHAQERYFEMDLMRRTAAGELAALFGPIAVDTDRRHRVHRMRARVDASLNEIFGAERAQAQAYVDGVNAGLADLRVRPWPYLLLRTQPDPWTLADSALTGYAMYFDLQDSTNARELALWRMQPHLPPALMDLLTRDGSRWDAPLQGSARGDAVLPSADAVDLRTLAAGDDANTDAPSLPADPVKGSNNFAVAGALTADGRAIVADDMHLGLRAPNIWFRARLRYPDPRAPGGRVDVAGFTLPGLPAVVVGSNGHVAWGFTNSYGDFMDWRLERTCAGGAPAATTDALPGACAPVTAFQEPIAVAGAPDVALEVRETAWGPVLDEAADGRALALRWVAHLPGSLTLGLAGFSRAGSLDDALRHADSAGMPGQNLVIGDRSGRIAWRLLGPLPQRGAGCSGTLLTSRGLAAGEDLAARVDAAARPVETPGAADAPCQPWPISAADAPALVDPPGGRLWTANARVVDGEHLAALGDAGYAGGARAAQIRDRLLAQQRFNERDLLAIQLDDRALFLQRWWALLQSVAAQDAETPRADTAALIALAAAAREWDGHASVDSVSYRITRAWRQEVHDRIAEGLTAPARAAMGDAFEMPALPQLEGVAWPLVTQRPAHLLPRRFESWPALFEDAARQVRRELEAAGPLAGRTWGERNTARICHPLAGALPGFVKPALCMPMHPLPGDSHMPRVQGPDFGASQRMVVAPGHEADGIAHMPGGQSGHPLSPFWGAGHDDWARGRASPFLPGATQHSLELVPAD